MDNNEIMEIDKNVEDEEIVEEEKPVMSTGMAMLLGAGLAFAGAKVFKFAKGAYAKTKSKRDELKTKIKSKVVDITDEVIEEEKDDE